MKAQRPVLALAFAALVLVLLQIRRADVSPPVPWAAPSGELRDLALRVRTLGTGGPTILLLHGLAGSNQYFGKEFDGLARDGRIVAPDLLGFGDSPRPDAVDYGPDAHAEAVIATLEALGVEAPVYVAAHSAGTLVALRLAARRPDWIRGIVAFGPPIYRNEKEARLRIGGLGGMVRLFAMDTLWAELACKAMYPFSGFAERLAGWIRADLPAPIAEGAVKHSWASYSGTVRNLILAPQPPRELTSLQIPIWLIAGDRDDVVDIAFLKTVAGASNAVRLELWSGGHDLPLVDGPKSAEAIRRLISSAAESAP